MYDMDNVYVCIVLTKWSNKNKNSSYYYFILLFHITSIVYQYMCITLNVYIDSYIVQHNRISLYKYGSI